MRAFICCALLVSLARADVSVVYSSPAQKRILEKAVLQHAQAQRLKRELPLHPSPAELNEVRLAYDTAAELYALYLQSPAPPYRRDYLFSRAEALYYADRFAESGPLYDAARDDPAPIKLAWERLDAALGAVHSYRREVEQRVKLPSLSPPHSLVVMPPEVRRYQAALDAFDAQRLSDARAPRYRLEAAQLDLRYGNLASARKRLRPILCGADEGQANEARELLRSQGVTQDLDELCQ